jgi:hypothetical protein
MATTTGGGEVFDKLESRTCHGNHNVETRDER